MSFKLSPVRGLKNLVKALLRRRGLTLGPRNPYEEGLAPVRYRWLREFGIRTVIDVGAGDGGFARRARDWFPDASFVCFEPLDSQFAGLVASVGTDPRFTLVKAALREKPGQSSFFRNEYAGSSSLLTMAEAHRTAYPYTAKTQPTVVECSTLDNHFAGTTPLPKVLLKIDVQGGELLVLGGGADTLRCVDMLFLEVSFQELYVGQPLIEDVVRFLDEAGFSLAGVENVSQSLVDGRCLQADAFFVRGQRRN